jgi:hypothetical protein
VANPGCYPTCSQVIECTGASVWLAARLHNAGLTVCVHLPPTHSPPAGWCSLQLPLYPLLQSKLILPDDIIIDAKSGARCHAVLGCACRVYRVICQWSDTQFLAAVCCCHAGFQTLLHHTTACCIMAMYGTGVSGAGRSAKESNLYCEIAEGINSYA